jgi:hypothetical protein
MKSVDVTRLLQRARLHFDREQRIPLDIAAKLMAHGVVVNMLEDCWSRE